MKTKDQRSLFTHHYIDNHAPHTLFLLHGTGGSEEDFLFLDNTLHKTFNLVGLRGNTEENGMNRFFKRVTLNVFDQKSIEEEVSKLRLFIESWSKEHDIAYENMMFLGYSNGANMVLSFLFSHLKLVINAVTLHPMLPFEPQFTGKELSGHHILVSTGTYDDMIPASEGKKVIDLLQAHGADVETHEYAGGHEISHDELSDVVRFIQRMPEFTSL